MAGLSVTSTAAGIIAIGLIAVHSVRGAEPASALPGRPSEPEAAAAVACEASIDIKNSGSTRLGLVQPSSYVKVRFGVWRRVWAHSNLQVTVYVDPGHTQTLKAQLDLGCDRPRRYRFRVTNPVSGRYEDLYRPGSDGWTQNNIRFTIDLADAPF